MDNEELLKLIISKKYYTSRQILYGVNPGLFLEPYNYKLFLDYMDEEAINNKNIISLDLLSFNSYKPRITKCLELLSMIEEYLKLIVEDADNNKSFLSFRNCNQITISRIFSEIEGSLNIESVPTTRKLLNDVIHNHKKIDNQNEQIIFNMSKAIEYVNKLPEFNEENLYNLYSILSFNCLDDEDELLPDQLYRHDGVEIDGYKGCPTEKIKDCMDSLFLFVNKNLKNSELNLMLPHIAHYYILYIHPYFDYNGRTSRMVSYWIHLLTNHNSLPPVISEAINQRKKDYYLSLSESRDCHNDLTYFLLYIYSISINYFLTYKNIELLDIKLKNKSIILNDSEKNYIKKILISSKGKFTYKDFIKWSNTKMSKQFAFSVLNKLCEYEVLNSETISNKKLFEINNSLFEYKVNY